MWTGVALVLMVLMGGIIAYNGDLIGRRFGKKRVTLFGLRPRYTAVLITSVTGVMISGITTAVLFLLVPSVRNVILEGEKAIAELPRLRRDRAQALSETAAVKKELTSAEARVETERAELAKVNAEMDSRQKALTRMETALARIESELTQARSQLATVRNQLQETRARNATLLARNRQLNSKNSLLADINTSLANSNGKLTEQNTQLTKDNATLLAQKSQLAQEYEEGSKRNIELTRQNSELERLIKDLDRQRTVLARVIDDHRSIVDDLKKQNDNLRTESQRLASENSELRGLIPGYTSMRDAYLAARSRRVAIHKDEDLARVVIPPDTDPAGVRSYIQSLIREASETAKARGASPGENLRAVQVMDRQFFGQLPDGQVGSIQVSGDDLIEAAVEKLAYQKAPCAVLAIAVTNSVEQEPAGIDLRPFQNHRIFQKGQLVFTRSLNATQPPQGIFRDVVSALKELGRTSIEKGIIPRMDPVTGEPEVGAMNYSEIVSLVERIRGVGGRVRLRAIAEDDIHSADLLNLRFEVMH